MKLSILLRTHSGSRVRDGEWALDISKTEMIHGCLRSLMNSLALLDPARYEIKLTIFDDHSSEECVAGIKEIVGKFQIPYQFISLEEKGNSASLVSVYKYADTLETDLIYFAEDDYLYQPSAFFEMLDSYELFTKNLGGREVGIFPVDYPDFYKPAAIQPSYIVLGSKRHWRTTTSSTGTFLISKKAFAAHRDLFRRFSQYGVDPEVDESNSINVMWRNDVRLFSPIPTLAIHLPFTTIVPPFTDVNEWWEKYAA